MNSLVGPPLVCQPTWVECHMGTTDAIADRVAVGSYTISKPQESSSEML